MRLPKTTPIQTDNESPNKKSIKQNLTLTNAYFIQFLYKNLYSVSASGVISGIIAFIIYVTTKEPVYFIFILLFCILALLGIHTEIYNFHFKKDKFKKGALSEDELNNMKKYPLNNLILKFISIIFTYFVSAVITFFAIFTLILISILYVCIFVFIITSIISFLKKLF